MSEDNKIPVNVVGVRQLDGHSIVVLLQEEDESGRGRVLPIFIGNFESHAINLGLKKTLPPRPLTHDLLQTFIEEFDAFVLAIEIVDMRDRTFFADIVIAKNPVGGGPSVAEEYTRVSARPSDAIALAVRVECPIYVFEQLMDEGAFVLDEVVIEDREFAGVGTGESDVTSEEVDEIVDRFRDFIEGVKPKDFDSPKESD